MRDISSCQPTAHRFAFSDNASLRVGQARTDSASLRFVSVMMSSYHGAPDSPLTPGGVESSVSYDRRPLQESLNIRGSSSKQTTQALRRTAIGSDGPLPREAG